MFFPLLDKTLSLQFCLKQHIIVVLIDWWLILIHVLIGIIDSKLLLSCNTLFMSIIFKCKMCEHFDGIVETLRYAFYHWHTNIVTWKNQVDANQAVYSV